MGEVAAIDKAEAKRLLQAFQADIEARASWGDKVSKVVATAVGLGKTAAELLA